MSLDTSPMATLKDTLHALEIWEKESIYSEGTDLVGRGLLQHVHRKLPSSIATLEKVVNEMREDLAAVPWSGSLYLEHMARWADALEGITERKEH